MAKHELIDILRSGKVRTWNELVSRKLWRSRNWRAKLRYAGLSSAEIAGANLSCAQLEGAFLCYARLRDADLSGADLSNADMRGADLSGAILNNADLNGALFTGAVFDHTRIGQCDLSSANGLATIYHRGPSTLGTDTLTLSRGKLPDSFLHGCGLADWEILQARLYSPELTTNRRIEIAYEVATQSAADPIQPHSVFISYTHSDSQFVDRLQTALHGKGVRSWRDIHDASAGPLARIVDRSIKLNPTMLVILSEASVKSSWVKWEIERGIELREELGREVLCPIRLDDAWQKLPPRLLGAMRDYNVLDFSAADAIEEQMPRLLKGLHIYYLDEPGLPSDDA